MDSAKSDYIRTLRRLALFTDLSDAELAQIAEGVSRLYFEEGTLIFWRGRRVPRASYRRRGNSEDS